MRPKPLCLCEATFLCAASQKISSACAATQSGEPFAEWAEVLSLLLLLHTQCLCLAVHRAYADCQACGDHSFHTYMIPCTSAAEVARPLHTVCCGLRRPYCKCSVGAPAGTCHSGCRPRAYGSWAMYAYDTQQGCFQAVCACVCAPCGDCHSVFQVPVCVCGCWTPKVLRRSVWTYGLVCATALRQLCLLMPLCLLCAAPLCTRPVLPPVHLMLTGVAGTCRCRGRGVPRLPHVVCGRVPQPRLAAVSHCRVAFRVACSGACDILSF